MKSSRPGDGAAGSCNLRRGIVWILLLGCLFDQSAAAELQGYAYRTTWAMAKTELDTERWRSAAPLYEKALRELEAVSGSAAEASREQKLDLAQIRSEYGLALLRIAWLQSSVSDDRTKSLDESHRQLSLSAAVARELDAPRILGDVYDNLAGWHFVKGAESQVIENLLLAQEHYERAADSEASTRVLNNLGMMHRKLGELRAAQSAFHAGLRSAEQGATDADRGHLYLNTSVLYRSLGDLEQAKTHAERSLHFFELAGMSRSAMASRSALAILQRELGDPATAYEQHALAREYFAAHDMSHDEVSTRQEEVIDLMQLGRIGEAYAISEALLADEHKFDLQASKLTMYANHARLLFETGQQQEALRFASGKLERYKGNNRDPFGQIALMDVLRDIFASSGHIDEAIAQAAGIFELIEDQRTEFETLRLGPLWSARTYQHYAEHIEFLLNSSEGSSERNLALLAFETIERARAVSLRQRRQEAILNRQRGGHPAGQDEWRELVKTLLSSQADFSDESASLEVERRFNVAREAFFAANGVTIDPANLPLLNIENLQARLTPDQVVLVFFTGPQSVWRYTVDSNTWEVSKVGQRSLIKSLTDAALYELTSTGSRSNENVATLSDQILNNMPLGAAADEILIVPADGMQGVPLSALRINGESVNEFAASIVVPSLSEYFAPSQPDERSGRLELAVFADPYFGNAADAYRPDSSSPEFRNWSSTLSRLPHSAKEASMLRELYKPGESVVFTGREANRSNLFSQNVMRAKVLHLATHGYFNEDIPDLIGFALAKDGVSDDGFVSMAEIAARNVDAELVVISACDTASGRQLAGEGTLSLTRTFLSQGADSVISTLWPVSDRATALFMREFYAAFKQQQLGLAESMRHAQLALKKHPRYKDPFYWSAYVLTSAKSSI